MGREARRKREQRQRAAKLTPTPGNPHGVLEMQGLAAEVVEFFPGPDAVEFTPTVWVREMFDSIAAKGQVEVPCGGCTTCCHHATVEIHEQFDDGASYQTHIEPDGRRILNQQADGSCIYLTNNQCSIYDRRPVVCRTFDCRAYMVLAVVPSPGFKFILEKANEKFKFPKPMSPADEEFIEAARFTFGYAVSVKKMDSEAAASYALEHWQEHVKAVRIMSKMRDHVASLSPEDQQKFLEEFKRHAPRGGR